MKFLIRQHATSLRLALILGLLVLAFAFSTDFQRIAAGVAVFLLGMMMLEDGFKALGGSVLERMLARATGTLPRALGFGAAATAITQSSSLVSVISISFLSAGLITLQAGIGIIFGANLGTTTGAWLIAGVGVKVDIAAYALPLLALGTVLMFQRDPRSHGGGQVLTGVGLLFLGIAFIKDGFDAFSAGFDLTRLALGGIVGLVVYASLGALATVVMQSSHATMLLVITALASGQIGYDNALAVAIGANIGTTVTALIGAGSANYQGKRLALAHLIFNTMTACVALVLIVPLRFAVDGISDALGIGADDFALRLAVFHTLFNLLGIGLMIPLIPRLIRFLERRIATPSSSISRPRFIAAQLGDFPAPILAALQNELWHLYRNAAALISEGLNMRLEDLRASRDVATTVSRSREAIGVDFDARYHDKVKSLHAAILDFTASKASLALPKDAQARLQELRDGANALVRAVKAAKHMRANVQRFTQGEHGAITSLYDALRSEIGELLAEIAQLEALPEDQRSALTLQEDRAALGQTYATYALRAERLLQARQISAGNAASFLNDARYAEELLLSVLDAAQAYFREPDSALAEIERILETPPDETAQGRAGLS